VRANQLQQTLMAVIGVASEGADPAGARRANSATALSSLAGRVLLAEDNPVNQEVAAGMLDRLGCEATAVATGAEAVAALERETYDLVLMDVQMPQMDGLTATRLIRNREARTGSSRIPIVALTANAFTRDAEACIAAGMDDYLSKPFTVVQLHTVLARRLSRAPVAVAPFAQEESAATVADNGRGRPDPAAPPREAVLDRRPLDALRALQRPGRPNVLEKVLGAFRESSSQLVAAMQAALSRGDGHAVYQAAHSLKSGSANVGATTLSTHCREIEALGRANALADATAVFERLEAEYALVEAALKRELETDGSDSAALLQVGRV
jgi:CheY-like chemotaxis protein